MNTRVSDISKPLRSIVHTVQPFSLNICSRRSNSKLNVFRPTTVRSLQSVLMPTLFEKFLKQRGIKHKLIKPYTPRHNGKVECSHRKDNEYFYATHTFYSFDDFKKQLAIHSRKYNNFPMRPLNWKSPSDYINAFLKSGQVF